MALRSPVTIAALFAVAHFVGTCFPSGLSDPGLSDAEHVWCDDRTVTVIAAADALNIGPEPKGSIDSPETLAQWSYRKASGDRNWVRACEAAYEGR